MVENPREKALTAYEGIFNKKETIEIDEYTYHLDLANRKVTDYTRLMDTATLSRP